MKLIDLTGKRFGKLTVISRQGTNKHKKVLWLCKCDCGKETLVCGSSLRSRLTLSCGCYGKQSRKNSITTHNKTHTRLFRVWQNIKRRCYAKTNPDYKYYGACGVKVCDEWLNSFQAFYDWAMQNGYNESAPKGQCTLDRIDTNGNYEPSNCRWVSMKVQNLNRKANVILEYNGKKQIAKINEKLKF